MIVLRLILTAIALFLVSFGIHPALEYSNGGALFMLAVAALIVVAIIFLHLIISILKNTIIGKIISLLLSLAIIYFGVVQFFIITHGRPHDPEFPPADVVIVLGAGLTYGTDQPSLALSYRLDKALEYLTIHPDTPVIVSGGQGEIELISEAESMKNYLVQSGISPSQITLEDNSRTTDQNLDFSSTIIEQNSYNTAAIVTTDYHCLRAEILADRHNIEATCIPAPNVWWLSPADHFREFLALTKTFAGH